MTCLIVSIPDLCTPTYFSYDMHLKHFMLNSFVSLFLNEMVNRPLIRTSRL